MRLPSVMLHLLMTELWRTKVRVFPADGWKKAKGVERRWPSEQNCSRSVQLPMSLPIMFWNHELSTTLILMSEWLKACSEKWTEVSLCFAFLRLGFELLRPDFLAAPTCRSLRTQE